MYMYVSMCSVNTLFSCVHASIILRVSDSVAILVHTQASRQPKRRVTTRDLQFYMEQTKETKKSLVLYRSLLK